MRYLLRQPIHRFADSLAIAMAVTLLVSLSLPADAARVTYKYDGGGRLKRTVYPDRSAIDYKNDAPGNQTNVVVSPPDTLLPSSPGAVSFASVTHNSMTVNWGAATDNVEVEGYDYQVNSGAWQSLGNVLTVNLTGLSSGVSYTVRVRARDTVGNVSATPSSNTATTLDNIAPSSPGAVSFSSVTYNSMTVNWGAATDNVGVAGYDYQVNSGGWQSLGNVLTRNLTGLSPSTSYTVRVRARDAAGNVSVTPSSNTTTTAPPDLTPPSIPSGFGPASSTTSTITLGWNPSTDTGGSGVAGYRIYRDSVLVGSPTGTSFTDTGLLPNAYYSYKVAAIDGAGNLSDQSPMVVGHTQPDTTAPTVPTGLSATPASSQRINLSWNASTDTGGSGVSGYQIFRNGTQLTTTTSTSFSDTGLSPNTTYSYAVAAYDGAFNVSSLSAAVPATTQPDTSAPSVPTGLSAAAVSSQQINLSWNASTDTGGSGLTGYRIYRNGSLLTTTSLTTYSNTGLSPSTNYTYTVAAYDGAGNASGQTSSVSATTQPDTIAPSVPSGFGPASSTTSTITLGWNPSTDTGGSGVAGYRIYRDSVHIGSPTGTSFTDTGLSPDAYYSYKVAAIDGAGNLSDQSPMVVGHTQPDSTAPSTPDSFTAAGVSTSQINLSWSASTDTGGSGLAGYWIYRDGVFVNSTTSTSYADTGLASGTAYGYSVYARDQAGNFSAPAYASATTPMPPIPGTLQLTATSLLVFEGVGTATLTVTRSGASGPFGAASVVCSTADGSGFRAAVAGVDYVATSQTLTWAAGDASPKSCSIPIIDDTAFELSCGALNEPPPSPPFGCVPYKDFYIGLSGASGATLTSPSSAMISIQNDDTP